MTLDEQIEILVALKEGKKIEARPLVNELGNTRAWIKWTGSSPNFACYEYRIVPEPRRWIIFMDTRVSARRFVQPYGEAIPQGATIICTATEDANLGEAAAPYLEALKEKIARP